MTHEGGAETSPGRSPTEGKSIRPFRAKRIAFLLVGIVAMAAVVASMAPLSGQSRDDLASKLARREVQRSPSSIPGREIVQVETLIPAGVESGWHVHPGEEVGYIIAGQVEMMVQGVPR